VLRAVLGLSVVLSTMPGTWAAEAVPVTQVDVEVRGLEDPLLENVRRFLSIAELARPGVLGRLGEAARGEDADDTISVAELRRRHRRAPDQIREALMPFGFYRPVIDSELTRTDDGYRAIYRVDSGEPARIRTLDLRVVGEGQDYPVIQQALAEAQLAEGDRLIHRRYEQAKSALFDAAYGAGFLEASWQSSEIRVAPDRLSAEVDLVLDTGPRFYFGEVEIRQQVFRPEFVARFVEIEPGEPYDVDRLLALQQSLAETNYFSRVEIQAEPAAAGPDQRVPVQVITEPAPSQRYTVGVGYGTDTGPRLKLGVLLRRINARGHRFRSDLQLSAIEQAIGVRYEIPIREVATDSVAFDATARKEEIGDAETEQFSLGASHLVSWEGFRRRLYVEAHRENFQFGNGPQQEVDLVYPGVTLTRERADDFQYPTRGYSIQADLRAGIEDLLSDVSFTRLDLTTRWVRGVARDTRVLLRAAGGVLWTDEFDRLPPSQRFFTGGDRSVRGYVFRDIGPRNTDGDVIGGERMLVGSVELEHIFYGNYGAALFVDAGDAFDDSPDFKVGAGLGFRWRSPIGVLRLDVAHPFDDPHDDVRLHVTIGADL
jgi:translocation and assembly module TamA